MDGVISVHDIQPRGDDPFMTHAFDVPDTFVRLPRLELVVHDFRDYLKVCTYACVCVIHDCIVSEPVIHSLSDRAVLVSLVPFFLFQGP